MSAVTAWLNFMLFTNKPVYILKFPKSSGI